MRCQFCGKNLWPLRGLFDEDFCSKDHRQRYHERVRKALEHLPKGQAGPKASGIAGFQFEKPRVQEAPQAKVLSTELWQSPSGPAVPNFAHTTEGPSFGTSSFSFASVSPATGAAPRMAEASATAIAPNVMSIASLRQRVHESQGIVATLVEAPAAIAPRPGNMALRVSERWTPSPEVFDELNHVYLHEPDPVLMASFPLAGSLTAGLHAVPVGAKARHTASAGPSGAGRVEFFPMQPRLSGVLPNADRAGDLLVEMASAEGENIWLEDLMSWRIPVALAPNRSSMAMLPATDRMAALELVRNVQLNSAASPAPLEWRFKTADLAQRREFETARPAVAPAMVIEFPAPRDGASAPLSTEVALFDASSFQLLVPDISVDSGDLDLLLATELADIIPEETDAQSEEGETLAPRATEWLPIEAQAVLPVSSPEMVGALAEAKIGADLVAQSLPSQLRNGAMSLNPGLPISLPYCAVRLKNGPDFFAAEPVIADSAARPVAARPYAAPVALSVPEVLCSTSDTLLHATALQVVQPAGAFRDEEVLSHAAEPMANVSMAMPVVEPQPAGFGSGELTKIDLWFRDTGDRSPHQVAWMEPQLALAIPDSHYEDYPLALQVDVPEPRTVTVFETAATYEQQAPKVLAINEAKSKRFAVPSYVKGMAAGLMLASFLWFGSSSIKTDGITLRPGDLIRLTIQRRAVVEVGDNFHAGLAAWDGKNFAKTWVYDKDGFMRPGRLALYKPSHDMTDYKMEFLTQIERKSVGWVFRAADDQNYYAMKLAVTEPGPRPLVALVRYSVIDGKKESRGETPVQVMMHNNRPYRVEVDVKGNQFLTSIEGQLVDSWSDDRLKSGGVGFFAEGSEKARLYWMKITKNSDFLGRLCSMLVPKES
ncbi:MAG: hypothetical protein LAP39_13905 [Acidobacteriia bacterium]|nr:hypothetical protein [Terriglobia bacterium]